MWEVASIIGIAAFSYFGWRSWCRSKELEALLEQARVAAAETAERAKTYCAEMDAINARMKDLHRSLNHSVCGRETTWP
jgi:transposase-like protein